MRRMSRRLGLFGSFVGLVLACHAVAGPGQHTLEGPVRISVPLDGPVLAGVSELDADGTTLFFMPVPDPSGKFGGILRMDGTEAEMSGKLRNRRGRWSFVAKAVALLDGKKDLSIQLAATLAGRQVTGTATIVEKSSGTKRKRVPLTGTLAGGFPRAFRAVDFHLDFVADAKGRIVARDGTVSRAFGPWGPVELTKIKGASKAAGDDDAVSLAWKAPGLNFRFNGINDGDTVTGTVGGTFGGHRVLNEALTFSAAPITSTTPIDIGSGTATVDLPPGGELTADVVITTDQGATLRIPKGSKLSTPTGQVLTGPKLIFFGTGLPLAEFPGGSIPDGTFRVAISDPAGSLPPDEGLREVHVVNVSEGTVSVFDGFTNTLTNTIDLGQASYPYVVPETDDLDGLDDEEAIYVSNFSSHSRAFPAVAPGFGPGEGQDIVLGDRAIVLTDPTAGPGDVPGQNEQDFEIPGDDTSEYPRVKSISVCSPGGGQVIAVGAVEPPGLSVDSGEAAAYAPGDNGRVDVPAFAFRVVGQGGRRFLRVRSRFTSPDLIIKYRYCLTEGDDRTGTLRTGNPPTPESTLAGPHAGPILVTFEGWGDHRAGDLLSFYARLRAKVPDGAIVGGGRAVPRAYGPLTFQWIVSGYEDSVESFAALLGPPFAYEFGPRSLRVRVACPKPLIGVGEFGQGGRYRFIDTSTFTLREPAVILPGEPAAAASTRNGLRTFVATGEQLVVIDPIRGIVVARKTIPGLSAAVAVNHTGGVVYVARQTGSFEALSTRTLDTLWSVGGLPQSFLTSISVTRDGGCAWLTSPLTGEVIGIDLVFRREKARFMPGGVQSVAVANGGHVLAVTDLNAGLVHIVDPATGAVLASVSTGGTFPVFPAFSLDDSKILTGNQGSGSLTVIDVATRTRDLVVPGYDGADGVLVVRDLDSPDAPGRGTPVIGGTDAVYFVDSFFDVFAEVTIDGVGFPLSGGN